jgi:hypothetical protein
VCELDVDGNGRWWGWLEHAGSGRRLNVGHVVVEPVVRPKGDDLGGDRPDHRDPVGLGRPVGDRVQVLLVPGVDVGRLRGDAGDEHVVGGGGDCRR